MNAKARYGPPIFVYNIKYQKHIVSNACCLMIALLNKYRLVPVHTYCILHQKLDRLTKNPVQFYSLLCLFLKQKCKTPKARYGPPICVYISIYPNTQCIECMLPNDSATKYRPVLSPRAIETSTKQLIWGNISHAALMSSQSPHIVIHRGRLQNQKHTRES